MQKSTTPTKVIVKREHFFTIANCQKESVIQRLKEFNPAYTAVVQSPFNKCVSTPNFELVLSYFTQNKIAWRMMCGNEDLQVNSSIWQVLHQDKFIAEVAQINETVDNLDISNADRVAAKETALRQYLKKNDSYTIVFEEQIQTPPIEVEAKEMQFALNRENRQRAESKNRPLDPEHFAYVVKCKNKGLSKREVISHLNELAKIDEQWRKYLPITYDKLSIAVQNAIDAGLECDTEWGNPKTKVYSPFCEKALVFMLELKKKHKISNGVLSAKLNKLAETDKFWGQYKPITVGKIREALLKYKKEKGIKIIAKPKPFAYEDALYIFQYKNSIGNKITNQPMTYNQTVCHLNELAKTQQRWAQYLPITIGRVVNIHRKLIHARV